MFKKFIVSTLCLLSLFVSAHAALDELHVVHNVFKGGFSIDGIDLFYEDESEKKHISLGDQFYIVARSNENIDEGGFRTLVTLMNPVNRETKSFKSRMINEQNSFLIVAVEKKLDSYLATLEDGSQFELKNHTNGALVVEPGDTLTFGWPSFYAVEQGISYEYLAILEDGSRHLLPNSRQEYKRSNLFGAYDMHALFFSGPILKWGYTIERTWDYPYCTFMSCSVQHNGIDLPSYFKASGLFKKPNPLYQPNTFRVRSAENYEATIVEKGPGGVCRSNTNYEVGYFSGATFHYLVVEFFDFYPGVKLNIENPKDIHKLKNCDTLKFIKTINNNTFLFETPKKEPIILSLILKMKVWHDLDN